MLKRIVLVLGVAAFTLVGCGGPPKEEMDKTTKAQQAAVTAKADVYAKEAFDAGVAAQTKGADAVKKSDWDGAKKSYMEATKQFDAATKAAPDAMKAMKDELTARFTKMEADHVKLMADKDMAKKVASMSKDDKAKVEKTKKECMDGMAACKEALAKDDLMTAKEKMDADDKMHADMMAMMTPKKK